MGEFDGDPGVAHLLAGGQGRVAQLGGQEGEDRAQPLAPGLRQVGGGRVDRLIGVADDLQQPRLDGGQGRGESALEFRGVQWERSDHGMSIAARPSTTSTACGSTPSATVRKAAVPIAAAVGPLEPTTMTVSPRGSWKNMSRIRRM